MIYILWATIRPQVFIEAHKKWMERSSDQSQIRTIVCVNSEEDSKKISDGNPQTPFYTLVFKTNKIGVCGPAYHLSSNLKCEDEDIVIFASDDFLPPENWDKYVLNKLSGRSGVLHCRDGYQLPDSSNMLHAAVTCPIMTGKALKQMNGIIYHPQYNHMFSDCELYLNAKELGILIDERMTDTTLFEHLHWVSNKRPSDLNDKSYYDNWKSDEIIWNKRKIMPVSERIKV